MKYRYLNCHSYTELKSRLIYLVKYSKTQFHELKNPSVQFRHLPKFCWLAVAINFFHDLIYIPSWCLAIRCCLYREPKLSCHIVLPSGIDLRLVDGENSSVCWS
jgi:hypothetical protein